MFILTSSTATEQHPFPISASQTISPCCSSLHYTPLRRRSRLTTKTVTTWPKNVLFNLQVCRQHTNWVLLEHQDLDTFTGTVLDYIKFCMGIVSVHKVIHVFPSQKPWMTSRVRSLLKVRDAVRSGGRALYSAARGDLKKGIKEAKADYKRSPTSPATDHRSLRDWFSGTSKAVPPTLTYHQFAYQANRPTEDAIAIALHAVLTHLEQPQNYARMLFVDYSSAFNTTILSLHLHHHRQIC